MAISKEDLDSAVGELKELINTRAEHRFFGGCEEEARI